MWIICLNLSLATVNHLNISFYLLIYYYPSDINSLWLQIWHVILIFILLNCSTLYITVYLCIMHIQMHSISCDYKPCRIFIYFCYTHSTWRSTKKTNNHSNSHLKAFPTNISIISSLVHNNQFFFCINDKLKKIFHSIQIFSIKTFLLRRLNINLFCW